MKKLIFGIFAMLCAASASTAQTKVSKQDILNQMMTVGEQHNEMLEYVYAGIKKNPGVLPTNASNTDKVNYLNSLIQTSPPYNPLPAAIAEITQNQMQGASKNVLQSLVKGETKTFEDITAGTMKLTSDEQAYFNSLKNILSRFEKDMPNLEKEINGFNESVFQKFGVNSNTTYILIAGSAVAKASANYWFINAEKWAALKNGEASKSSTGKVACCGGLGSADLNGAVGGAIGGAVSGAAVGGVGAIPGAAAGALGGAITSSTVVAVKSLISWLWD